MPKVMAFASEIKGGQEVYFSHMEVATVFFSKFYAFALHFIKTFHCCHKNLLHGGRDRNQGI